MSSNKSRQHDLDREIALVTGETLGVIRRRGFSVIDLREQNFDPEPDIRRPFILDWDEVDQFRLSA